MDVNNFLCYFHRYDHCITLLRRSQHVNVDGVIVLLRLRGVSYAYYSVTEALQWISVEFTWVREVFLWIKGVTS